MKLFKHFFFLLSLIALLVILPARVQAATSLYVGQSTILSAPTPPSGAALNQTAWSCSNANVSVERYMTYGAKVTINSYFTGTAEIRCDYYYYWYDKNGYMHTNNATTYFQIVCNPVNISISPTSMRLDIGEGQTISYSYSPSNISPKPTVRFISNNTNVATVNDNGYVKAIGSGNATITVENSAGPNATCSVEVPSPEPTGITLPSSLSLIVGESKTITPTVRPAGAQYSLSWSSSNENVATVSASGNIRGIKAGNARIIAKIDGYNLSDYCDVNVEKPTLTIKANYSSGLLRKGTNVKLTASNSSAMIFYTIDGSTPNQGSLKYTAPIAINQNLTLKAIAYHNDYKTSAILINNYEVTSLTISSMIPEKGATDLGRNTIPSVTFNTDILQGSKFADIKLTKGQAMEIQGEKIISGNTLYFVPDEDLSTGQYTLSIPAYSLQNNANEPNLKLNLSFSVKGSFAIPQYGQGLSYMGLLKSDGTLWLWGGSSFTTPEEMYSDVKEFAIGEKHIMFIRNDNTLWVCGDNTHGQIGNSTTDRVSLSSPVKIMDDVLTIAAGYNTSYAVKTDGSLWSWGSNQAGQIGDGTHIDRHSPLKIMDGSIKKIYAGDYTAIAISNSDQMWRWGRISDSSGGHQTNPSIFMSNVLYASINHAFGYKALVIKNDHSLWKIHNNNQSQIMDNIIHADDGNYQSLALNQDHSLWIWGWNDYGQLGIGSTSNSTLGADQAVKVMDNVQYAWSGTFCCAAIKEDGSVWTWGRNNVNQLGDGTSNNRSVPVKIMEAPQRIIIDNVTILADDCDLHVGEKCVLRTVLSPINGEYNSITWSVDDESIASITSRGILTAKAIGKTIVRLTVETNEGVFNSSMNISITGSSGIQSTTMSPLKTKVCINGSNLILSNLTHGENIMVYNSVGHLLFKGRANNEIVSIPLNSSGLYVVKVGSDIIKVPKQ